MSVQSQYLLDQFREWEGSTGKRQSVANFARYLGVSNESLARWMRGDGIPDYANTATLAKTLGVEVYAVMGYETPSPIIRALHETQETYDAIPPEAQQTLIEQLKIINETYAEFKGRRLK